MKFFSIVIPAHNEERELVDTLSALQKQSYPSGSWEVLVVENGSTDKTLEIAKRFESETIKILVSEKGVSIAKNKGLENVSSRSNWVIFLDADTKLGKEFLTELNTYLTKRESAHLTIGTTTVLPLSKSIKARIWFAFYNVGHLLTHTSFSIQIMNADFRKKVKFDETRKFGEDLLLIKELKKYGTFFYFKTNQVETSTRRFEEVGWTKLFFKWNIQALVYTRTHRKTEEYSVIR